jgi:tripartite ATP-independent transporter DctP family solute receptor
LGGDPQMLAQARAGSLEFVQLGANVLASVVPAAALLSMPFAFRNAQQFQASANGPLGSYIGNVAAKIGLRKSDTAFYGGFFEVQNRIRPINVPADFKGIKLRVPPGPIDVGTFKAFEASPTVISLGEVYTSLQTHVIDGIEVPLPSVKNFKFYEQVKYCSLTHHSGLAYFLLANNDAWDRLPKNLQEIVDREFSVAAAAASKAFAGQEGAVEAELTANGMTFNRPVLEPFSQVIRSSGLYKEWREQFDVRGWEMLEKTTGKLV